MINLVISNRYTLIQNTSKALIRKLEKITSYKVEGYYFSPAYRQRRWDGKEHLLKFSKRKGYRIPTGLINDIIQELRKNKIKFKIIDERKPVKKHIDFSWNEGIELRPHQLEAIAAATEKGLTEGRGILKMPIRSGKTKTAAGIIRALGCRSLFVVPSTLLLYQTQEDLSETLLCPVGIIGDSQWDEENITVITVQTLTEAWNRYSKGQDKGKKKTLLESEYGRLITSYDLLILDECFPAGTLIDGRPIEKVEAGSTVTSYDEKKKELEQNKVVRTFENKASTLIEVKAENGASVVCTLNHPFLTKDGWKPAFTLNHNDMVLYIDPEVTNAKKKNISNSSLFNVQQDFSNIRKQAPILEGLSKSLLFKRVQKKKKLSGNDSNKQEVCFRSYEKKQPNEEPRIKTKNERNITCDELEAPDPRWKRKTNAKTAASVGKISRLANRICRTYKSEKGKRLSNALQNRHCRAEFKNCGRSRRLFTRFIEKKRARPKERKILNWVRVDSVKIYKQRGNGKISNLYKRNIVYNLEVEKNHTYLANGFVVHNCHHFNRNEWSKAIMNFDCFYRLGLSATVFLENDKECERGIIWLKAICGDVKIDIPVSRLIEEGYLLQPNVKLYKIHEPDLSGHRWSATLQNEAIYENEIRNNKIADIALELSTNGMKVLIISNRKNQTKIIYELLTERNLNFKVITGKETSKYRIECIKNLKTGKIDGLVGTVIGEGVDIPEAEAVINAEGGKDIKRTFQRMRNLTPNEGKVEAVFVDFMDLTNSYFAKHSLERLKFYRTESAFKFEVVD